MTFHEFATYPIGVEFPLVIVGIGLIVLLIAAVAESATSKPGHDANWYRVEKENADAKITYELKQAELEETRRFLKERRARKGR